MARAAMKGKVLLPSLATSFPCLYNRGRLGNSEASAAGAKRTANSRKEQVTLSSFVQLLPPQTPALHNVGSLHASGSAIGCSPRPGRGVHVCHVCMHDACMHHPCCCNPRITQNQDQTARASTDAISSALGSRRSKGSTS